MIGIVLTCILIIGFPLVVGTIFLPLQEKGGRLVFSWAFGQITLWAGFLAVSVPMILTSKTYSQVRTAYFVTCGGLLLITGIVALIRWRRKKTGRFTKPDVAQWIRQQGRGAMLLWLLFLALLCFQLFCVFFLTYEDGDDSYYVAITTYCKYDKLLYQIEPYTGYTTLLDVRHALAPFPVWVAILAELSGLSGAAASHVVTSAFTLMMAYGFYYLIGKKLTETGEQKETWKLPLFLVICAMLVTFGGYSIYSPEKFLVTRAAQGKTILANLIIPAVIYLIMTLMERLEKKEKVSFLLWLAMFMTMSAGCLCSSLGGFLLCILAGIGTLCGVIAYGRWKLLAGACLSMLMPAVIVILYVILPPFF